MFFEVLCNKVDVLHDSLRLPEDMVVEALEQPSLQLVSLPYFEAVGIVDMASTEGCKAHNLLIIKELLNDGFHCLRN